MTKTINELLEDCSDPFTKEDYLEEKAELEKLIWQKYGLKPEEIPDAMRQHEIPHEELDLCDRWIQNEAFRPFVLGDEDTQDCIPAVKV